MRWLDSNSNKEKINELIREQASTLETMVNGTISKVQAQASIQELSSQIRKLEADGRKYSFDSPIEETMYQAMQECFSMYHIVDAVEVIPQYIIGCYRLDFAVFARNQEKEVKLDIECDGFDYHSATRKQATHDKRRDRILTTSGFTVLRFTGQ
jgi:very-short-patch-repair endonuclease